MKILGIETSCDETAVCLLETEDGRSFSVLGNTLLSQVDVHREFGGVYPNLAKREHAKNLVPLLEKALKDAHMLTASEEGQFDKEKVAELRQLLSREPELFSRLMLFIAQTQKPDIDAIAVTSGPGLEPALWVGINFAKALTSVWQVPVVPVNHMEGHIFSALMRAEENPNSKFPARAKQSAAGRQIPNKSQTQKYKIQKVRFPVLALLISGGHTELVLMKDFGQYELVGETRDDAVGEAFDKVARLLGLPYPGGPEISKLAEHAREKNSAPAQEEHGATPRHSNILQNVRMSGLEGAGATGKENAVEKEAKTKVGTLPRPMIDSGDCDFSFSGLKTAVLYTLRRHAPISDEYRKQLAREFEDAVTDVLVEKTMRALAARGAQTLAVGGGVAANANIRRALRERVEREFPDATFLLPEPALTTDNAIMIGTAGYFRVKRTALIPALDNIVAEGHLRIA